MLAQQEPAHNEMRASAHKSFDIGSIPFVQRYRNWLLHRFFPLSFEVFPPCRELAETANVIQHHIQLPVICRRELCYQDPRKEVKTGQTKVMEVILLHAPPTALKGE